MRQAELVATSLTGNEICGNRHSESILDTKPKSGYIISGGMVEGVR
jgi:hypothetical protein